MPRVRPSQEVRHAPAFPPPSLPPPRPWSQPAPARLPAGGHPLPAVIAFLVFLLAYTPCVATLAAQKREVGLRWTLVGVGVQLAVAWVLAVAIFQVGRVWW